MYLADLKGNPIISGSFPFLLDTAEKEKKLHGGDYQIVRNDVCLYRTDDDPALKNYLRFTNDSWNNLDNADGTSFEHEKSDKPSVYFDIDGTLGYWYADGRGMSYPEEILDPKNHYFRNIEEHPFMIELAERLQEQGYDVCIMSAADRDAIRDKWEWIDDCMPFVKKENICFCPIGADKTGFVKGNAELSVLVDDYPKNLDEWTGISVKAINSVNSHQNKYYEINGIEAERDFSKWDDLMSEAEGTVSMLLGGRYEILSEYMEMKPYVELASDYIVSQHDDMLTCVANIYIPDANERWHQYGQAAFDWNKDGQVRVIDIFDNQTDLFSTQEICNEIKNYLDHYCYDFECEKTEFVKSMDDYTLENLDGSVLDDVIAVTQEKITPQNNETEAPLRKGKQASACQEIL